MTKMNNFKKNRGYTFVEFMIVAALLALALAGTVQAVSASLEESKLDAISEDMSFIASKMQKCGLANSGNYTSCTYASLRSRGYLDSSWGTGVARNKFNGDYTTAVVAGNTNRFTVGATAIPNNEYCLQLQDRWSDQSVVAPTCATGTFTVTQGTR